MGITKARGAEMEKNNEEYVCPQCTQLAAQGDTVTSTEISQVYYIAVIKFKRTCFTMIKIQVISVILLGETRILEEILPIQPTAAAHTHIAGDQICAALVRGRSINN